MKLAFTQSLTFLIGFLLTNVFASIILDTGMNDEQTKILKRSSNSNYQLQKRQAWTRYGYPVAPPPPPPPGPGPGPIPPPPPPYGAPPPPPPPPPPYAAYPPPPPPMVRRQFKPDNGPNPQNNP